MKAGDEAESVRWVRAQGNYQLLGVGLLWLLLTLSFEFLLGRLVLGYTRSRIGAEYNLPKGGMMPIGLLLLTASLSSQPGGEA